MDAPTNTTWFTSSSRAFVTGANISIESGIQNGTLAITLALTVLGNSVMAIPGAIYALIMFFTGGVIMYYFGSRKDTPTP